MELSDTDTIAAVQPKPVMDSLVADGRDKFWVLYSGGKDSVVVADWVEREYPERFQGVLHADTTAYLPQCREFVEQYCEERGWDLRITRMEGAFDDFFHYVSVYGFPTSFNHRVIMGYLKYHGWRRFAMETGDPAGNPIISGVRRKESFKRRTQSAYTRRPVDYDGSVAFAKPFWDWTGERMLEYYVKNGLKRSPSYDMGFSISGDCLCGSYTEPHERAMIAAAAPEFWAKVTEWEGRLADLGYGDPEKIVSRRWGEKPPDMQRVRRRGRRKKHAAEALGLPGFAQDMCGESCNYEPEEP